nr:unnamed protein product [Digitaria exilis]
MGITGRKRLREEQEVPMAPQAVRDPRPQLTTEDSVQFVLTLKSELAGERGKYDEFIAIMREFKDGGLQDLAGAVERIKALLAGYPSLIRKFTEFLPWDYIRSQGQAGGSGI